MSSLTGGVLVVPFLGGRGRKRITAHPEASQPLQNWRDLLDGCAAKERDKAEVSYFPERIAARGQDTTEWPGDWFVWAMAGSGLCKQTPFNCYKLHSKQSSTGAA